MPTVEEIRQRALKDAKDATTTVDSAANTLSEALSKVRTAAAQSRQVGLDLGKLGGAEALPEEFTGIVRDYRFGMLDVGIPTKKGLRRSRPIVLRSRSPARAFGYTCG